MPHFVGNPKDRFSCDEFFVFDNVEVQSACFLMQCNVDLFSFHPSE